jgi:hypothetical protein
MMAIMGAGVFSIVIVLPFLIVCGLPLGEYCKYEKFFKK